MTSILCPKCKGIPERSIVTGQAFVTHICYPACGNVFWTLYLCPNCQLPQKTIFLKKPSFGDLIKCVNCSSQMHYFRCPIKGCLALFFKYHKSYTMGAELYCQTCKYAYKNIFCPCGGEVRFDPKKVLLEGFQAYKCQCCKKDIIYTNCIGCNQPDYHLESLDIGDKIRCTHCKKRRSYVPCPKCGRATNGDKFSFCELIRCDFCKTKFQYSRCPFGCGVNYHYNQFPVGPTRKCHQCKRVYYVLNCKKCQHSIYLQDLESLVGRKDKCPQCRSDIQFYFCSCGTFSTGELSCKNKGCPPPKKCIDVKKQQQMKKDPKNQNYSETECKLCFSAMSTMINETCSHIMMCELCYRKYRGQKGPNLPCPICKAIGAFYRYKEPKYT